MWKALDDCWLSLLFLDFVVGARTFGYVVSQHMKAKWQKGSRYPSF